MDSATIDTNSLNQETLPSLINLYDNTGMNSETYKIKPVSESIGSPVLDEIFSLRNGIILNEKWDNSYLLSARISSISESFVCCEVIINRKDNVTQIRKYPIIQFNHLSSLRVGKTIKIKINEKPGSFRVDILDGANTGIEKEFESMISRDKLSNFKMDNPKDLND